MSVFGNISTAFSALSVDGNISTLDTITFAKRASQFGVPSPTIIDILNVISFSLESKFHFYISGFQYLDSHSTKFQALQLPRILKMETTLSISCPTHFEVFLETVQL